MKLSDRKAVGTNCLHLKLAVQENASKINQIPLSDWHGSENAFR